MTRESVTRPPAIPEDASGGRVALIVPPANPVAEVEIAELLPRSIRLQVGRLARIPSDDLLERVGGYDRDIERAAAQFGALPVDAVALAFAATSFLRGRSREQELLDALRSGRNIPAVTAADAMVQRLLDLDRRRIVVVTPYPDGLDALALEYWKHAGLDVVDVVNVIPPGGSIYAIRAVDVAQAVLDHRFPGDAAIALCGTGMASVGQLWRLQRETGVPCISYNSAIAWWVMREVGPFAVTSPDDDRSRAS